MKKVKRYIPIMLALLLVITGGCGYYDFPQSVEEQINADSGGAERTPEPTATASPRPRPEGDSVFTLDYEPGRGFNPYTSESATNYRLSGLCYESLFILGGDFTYSPNLCDKWSMEDGGYKYRFEIKSGIKMHDGSDLSIFDVVYSINLARESERFSKRFKDVSAVYISEGDICVELDTPNTELCALLDIPVVKDGTGYDSIPVGSGPYVYAEINDYVCMKAFEGYRTYDTLPISRFYLKNYGSDSLINAFSGAFVDLVVSELSNTTHLEYKGDCEVRYCEGTTLHFLGFNTGRGFCAKATHRIIISSAADRELLSKKYVAGTVPTRLPVSPFSRWYDRQIADISLVKPEDMPEYLIRSLVEDYDGDGQLEYIEDNIVWDFVLEFIVNKDNLQKVAAARKITAQLTDMGFDVKLLELGWYEYLTRLNTGEYDMYYGEVKLPANFDLSELLCDGGGACYGFYDTTLQNYVSIFNSAGEEQKPQAASDLFVYLTDNAYIAPLLFERVAVYTHRGVVSNMTPSLHNVFSNVAEWTIDLS